MFWFTKPYVFLGIFKYWFGDYEEINEEDNEEFTEEFTEVYNEEITEDFPGDSMMNFMRKWILFLKCYQQIWNKNYKTISQIILFYKISIVFTKYYILMVHLNSLQ